MMYHITGLCPRTDISLSRCNFSIQLFPAWKEAVTAFGKTQCDINTAVKNLHRAWLDGCGFSEVFDPENSGFGRDQKKRPSKSARPLYGEHDIRVGWGEWGPEHITVPGNACGLDIELGHSLSAPRDGKVLHPNNIDRIDQVMLLLVVFTWFADCLICERALREMKKRA